MHCCADPVSEEFDVLHDVSNEDEVLEGTDCVDVHVSVNEGHCSDLFVLKLPDVDLCRRGGGGGGGGWEGEKKEGRGREGWRGRRGGRGGRKGEEGEEGRERGMSEGGVRKELSYVPSGRHSPGVDRPLPPERSQDSSALLSPPAEKGEGTGGGRWPGEGGEKCVTHLDSLPALL